MKRLVTNILLLALLVGCSTVEPARELKVIGNKVDKLITVNPLQVSDTVELLLSEFITDLEVIRLDNNSDAYIKDGTVNVSDNYIAVRGDYGKPAKLFERKTGRFVGNIGNAGRGLNEYVSITNLKIDEKSSSIYLLPMMGDNILVFDLDAKFKSSIPLNCKISKGAIQVDSDAKTIAVANMPFKDQSQYVVWVQDFEGNVIHGVDATPYFVENYDNEMFHKGNTESFDLFFTTQQNLWNYDTKNNKIETVFGVDLQGRKAFYVLTELPSMFICEIFGGDVPSGGLFVDKTTLKGAWYTLKNDLLGGYKMNEGFFWDGYYQWNAEPLMLLEKLEPLYESAKGAARDKIKYILDNVKEDDNNVIMLGKLK